MHLCVLGSDDGTNGVALNGLHLRYADPKPDDYWVVLGAVGVGHSVACSWEAQGRSSRSDQSCLSSRETCSLY